MAYYFLVLGIGLIAGSLYLLWRRWVFLRGAARVIGKVVRVRRMDFYPQEEGGPSKHIEVVFTDDEGGQRTFVADNALLAYRFRPGDPIDLAVWGERVLVNTPLNIVAAPLSLFVLGAVTASLYVLVG
jgi:hypothetical protein